MRKNKLFVIISFVLCGFIKFCFSQPFAVTDLTPSSGFKPDEIILCFTYPGPDILPIGSNYFVQYSTYTEGVVWSTTSAQVVISTYNILPNQQQIINITNLYGNNTYYFHLWISSGTEQLLSDISNRSTFYLQGEVLLEIQKDYSVTTKRPGDEITYTITYKNMGNIKTSWFKIEDRIPTYTEYKPNSIKVNNLQKTDDSDEEEEADAEFNNNKIIVIFDDIDAQILPNETGVVEFKVIIK